jgi:hypothetical protein
MRVVSNSQLPHQLIKELYDAERLNPGSAVFSKFLSETQCQVAYDWLQRVLLDFAAFEDHISLLQELNGSKFALSRSRVRVGAEAGNSNANGVSFSDSILSDSQVTFILDEGMQWLQGNEEVATRLFLNPAALFDLFDVINELQPDKWIDETYSMLANQSVVALGASVALPETDVVSSESVVVPELSDSPAYLREQHLVSGLRRAQRLTFVVVSAACVAILAFGWVVITNQYSIEKNLSLLASGRSFVEAPNQAIEFHSSKGETAELVGLFELGRLNSQLINSDPKGVLGEILKDASPQLRLLIDQLEDTFKLREDPNIEQSILEFLRSLAIRIRESK